MIDETAKDVALAHLLAGQWIDNEYYDKSDFNYLSVVRFRSTPPPIDTYYVERIYNPDRLQVMRSYFGLAGKIKTEIVSLKKHQFWSLVKYVEAYYEKYHMAPTTPVMISEIDLDSCDTTSASN